MPRKRQGVKEVQYGGYTYRPILPVSEQPPVLRVSCKFSPRIENIEDVSITKEELLGFASVYHRIYQVPEKTRDRLMRWRRAHRRMVESWRMPFWNSKADDQRLGLHPRKPGVPPGAKGQDEDADEESDGTIDRDKMDLDRSSDPVTPRDTTPASSPTPANVHPRLPPAPLARDQTDKVQIDPQTLFNELKASRDALKDMFLWFQRVAVTVDDKDPLKESLMQMSCAAAKSLGRASEAVENANVLVRKGNPESEEDIAERIAERRELVARQTYTQDSARQP